MSIIEIVYLCLAIWFSVGLFVLGIAVRDGKIDDWLDCILILVLALPVGAYTLIENLIDKLRKKRKPKE